MSKLGPIGRLGRYTATHVRVVAITWLLVALTLGFLAPRVEHALSGAGSEATGSESVMNFASMFALALGIDKGSLPWAHSGEHRSTRFAAWGERLWKRPFAYGVRRPRRHRLLPNVRFGHA